MMSRPARAACRLSSCWGTDECDRGVAGEQQSGVLVVVIPDLKVDQLGGGTGYLAYGHTTNH